MNSMANDEIYPGLQ